MCKKHRIGLTTYQKIIDNKRPSEPTEEWRKILDSVNISSQISEDNQESLQSEDVDQISLEPQCNIDTFSSTNIQGDGTIHAEDVNITGKIVMHPSLSL
ncbi:2002_t:CDS:2 [Funneliformis geosporum]|nr:2002_t:CDS:2 [Funneliformis geosporum]